MEALQRTLPNLEREPAAGSVRPFDQGIESRFAVPFVAKLALKEKQIQQNVRPIISVHKWFARRPGTLFRALLLAEFSAQPLETSFFRSHRFDGLRVADPFMGGGTPLFEANRLGCEVAGWDVNPMAYWVVRQELTHLDLDAYLAAARGIGNELERELGHLYRTSCRSCSREVPVKYFVWVKVCPCAHCGRDLDLFPGYLLAADQRHPKNVLICAECGALTEVEDREAPGNCSTCAATLVLDGPAGRGSCRCRHCGEVTAYPDAATGPPRHRLVALEYHCWHCKPEHRGRFFKRPDAADLERCRDAERAAVALDGGVVPDDPIPPGDETDRLHRWGYSSYRQMFNPRQLLGLARLAQRIAGVADRRLRHALATNLSDLLRYQNMLCRYDTRSLKSLDIFSVHGFPVGLVQAESNLLGIQHADSGRNVGSGGWSNVVEKFARAKEYCDQPFEFRYTAGGKKVVVPTAGEWIGDRWDGEERQDRRVTLHCGSAEDAELEDGSLDAVLTDPPYYANVQYAELMDFCYAWLRRLVDGDDPAFAESSTRSPRDLTGNQTLERGLEHFVAGLSRIYTRLARALVPGRPFVFTYHHNSLDAYYPVAVALLDAGLVCTASLPCPAEMGGSIHIHGSGSSIVDTVFVCRSTGRIPAPRLVTDADSVTRMVARDLADLRAGSVEPTDGDARCVTYGHLARLAIWQLRGDWDADASWTEKLERVATTIGGLPSWAEVQGRLEEEGRAVSEASEDQPKSAGPAVHDSVVTF